MLLKGSAQPVKPLKVSQFARHNAPRFDNSGAFLFFDVSKGLYFICIAL